MDCFRELGLEWDADEKDSRRAYAALIRQYRPDSHPAEFARVREAYETAMRICRMRFEHAAEEDTAEEDTAEETPDSGEARPDEPGHYDLQHEDGGNAAAHPQPVRTARVVTDAPDSLNPDAVVAEMMRELDVQAAAGDEARTLQAFNEQWQALSAFSLDVQMDYAHALREWVIYSGRAPMRLILAAAERFGWHAEQREVEHHYGREGVHHLEMLLELADHYAVASAGRSPYLAIDDVPGGSPPRIASHYATDWAKMQVRQWRAACDSAQMPELGPRLRFVLPRRAQVYWVDVFLAVFAEAVAWLANGPVPDWRGWLTLCLLGPALLFTPALVRAAGAKLGADSPYRVGLNLARRYRDWRARKLAADGDDALLTREVTLTLLLGAVFIYGALILVKDSGALVWAGMVIAAIMILTALYILFAILTEIEKWLTGALRLLVRLPRRLRPGGQARELQDQMPRRPHKPRPKRARSWSWAGNIRWWWVALVLISQLARVFSQH